MQRAPPVVRALTTAVPSFSLAHLENRIRLLGSEGRVLYFCLLSYYL
jgi:hypothetical protein